MKKRTIYISLFLIFIIGVVSLIGTFAIDSTITEGNSSKADYLFNIVLGDRTNRDILIPSYDSKIVDIKISNPNEFNISYLLYLEGVNSNISAINISDTGTSGVINSKSTNLIKVFIQNNSGTDTTVSIKDIVGFEKEVLELPSNSTAINKGPYYKAIVKSNNNAYGKVKPNIKLSANAGTVKYTIVPNDGYQYKSTTCEGTIVDNILTISNITSNVNCEVVFEPSTITISYDATGGNYGTTTYTEAQEHTYKAPYNGSYKIELWGAQGGGTSALPGGYGSYTSGNINLNVDEELYIYVGENYNGRKNSISFNGGGKGTYSTSESTVNYNGGGATDVRYFGTYTPTEDDLAWDSTIGLNSRIMVAAGGGGYSSWGTGNKGGNAGGLTGYEGNRIGSITASMGGTQTSGGAGADNKTAVPYAGTFGTGGYSNTYSTSYIYVAGGGGGYYGGGSGGSIAGSVGSAAGGSSYISGHTGSVAITSSSNRTPRNDSSNSACTTGTSDNFCSIHYSNKKFTDTVMIDGSGYSWTNTKGSLQQMPTINGGLHESGIGNSGNGSAKITMISASSHQAYYGGSYGTLPTPSKEGYEFAGWYTEPNGKGTLVTEGSKILIGKDHTLYAYWVQPTEYTTSGSYTYTVPRTGLYKLETWGAQGGTVVYSSTTYRGGYGGYSTGMVSLKKGDILYLNVGGAGTGGISSSTFAGGYNGGGAIASTNTTTDHYHASGGGATHIATKEGLLSTLSSDINSILIVSGGGGGGYRHTAGAGYSSIGGEGGGHLGAKSTLGGSNGKQGLGGSQTEGGKYTGSTESTSTMFGSFGQGGTTNKSWGSAGGGGFYGGGASFANTNANGNSGGGGGSGYIGNSLLTDKYMYCYNCTTSDEESTKTYTTTNVSDTPTSDYAKGGDGAIKITFIGADTEPPTGTMTTSKEYNIINASIDATDNFGIDHYEYYLSTSSTCPTAGYTTSSSNTHSFAIKKTGTYYVCAKVVDGNDNTLSLKSDAIEITRIYSVAVRYNVNGGTISPSTGTYTWTTDSTGLIYRNGSIYEQTIYYGEPADLADYNNSNLINIDPGNLHVQAGGEWICLSGCSTANKVFNQATKYNVSDFCDVTSANCTVVVGLRLVSDTTKPTCSLSASGTTITATYSDEGGSGLAYYGWSSSYSGSNSSTGTITGAKTYTFYVKDGAGNTNTCSGTVANTTASSYEDCGGNLHDSGGCYYYTSASSHLTGSYYCKRTSTGRVTQYNCANSGGANCPSGYTLSSNNCSYAYSCSRGYLVNKSCKIYTSGTTVTTYSCAGGYTKLNDSYCWQ